MATISVNTNFCSDEYTKYMKSMPDSVILIGSSETKQYLIKDVFIPEKYYEEFAEVARKFMEEKETEANK